MVSPYKLLGYTLQIAGMAILFFGFIMLVTSLQKTVGAVTHSMSVSSGVLPQAGNSTCDPEADELCGVDMSNEGAAEALFSQKVYDFLIYLGVGIFLIFAGLLLRAGEEIGGFFAKLKGKGQKQRVMVGKPKWEDTFRK